MNSRYDFNEMRTYVTWDDGFTGPLEIPIDDTDRLTGCTRVIADLERAFDLYDQRTRQRWEREDRAR